VAVVVDEDEAAGVEEDEVAADVVEAEVLLLTNYDSKLTISRLLRLKRCTS
jgi:hypothetical protein